MELVKNPSLLINYLQRDKRPGEKKVTTRDTSGYTKHLKMKTLPSNTAYSITQLVDF